MAIDIAKYIKKEAIITDLKANTKTEAISELVDKVSLPIGVVDKEEVLRQVLEREKLQSTGVGSLVAFPHARIQGWGEFVVVLGISRKGIDFDSADNKPVNFKRL